MTSEKEICIMRTKRASQTKLSAECSNSIYYKELSNEKCATLVTSMAQI
jgi:hypothetical protein